MSSLYGFSISSGKNGRAGTLRGFQIITGNLGTLTFLRVQRGSCCLKKKKIAPDGQLCPPEKALCLFKPMVPHLSSQGERSVLKEIIGEPKVTSPEMHVHRSHSGFIILATGVRVELDVRHQPGTCLFLLPCPSVFGSCKCSPGACGVLFH